MAGKLITKQNYFALVRLALLLPASSLALSHLGTTNLLGQLQNLMLYIHFLYLIRLLIIYQNMFYMLNHLIGVKMIC